VCKKHGKEGSAVMAPCVDREFGAGFERLWFGWALS
jgi:hypothetical protein